MEKINNEKIEAVRFGVQSTKVKKGTSALRAEDNNLESSGSSEIERKTPKVEEVLKEEEKYKEGCQWLTEASQTKAVMLSSLNEVNKSNNFISLVERQAEMEKRRSEAVVSALKEGDSTKCSRKLQTGEGTSKDVERSSETSQLKVGKRIGRNKCRPPPKVRRALREAAAKLLEESRSSTIKEGENSSNNEDSKSNPPVKEEVSSVDSKSLKNKPENAKIPMAIVAPLTKEGLITPTRESLENKSSLETTPLKDDTWITWKPTKRKRKKSKYKTGLEGNSLTSNTTQPINQKQQPNKQPIKQPIKQPTKQTPQAISHTYPNMVDMVIRQQQNMLAMQGNYLVPPIFSHLQNQVMLGSQGLYSSMQGNFSGNYELPMMNQGHYLGNSWIPPLMQFNDVNMAYYQEYLRRNEANQLNVQGHPGSLSGSQEYPSRSQMDLLAQPSTSKMEVNSQNFYGSQEYSSSEQCKRVNDIPPVSSTDSKKRDKFFDTEMKPHYFEKKRILIAEDFGDLSLGFDELLLVRVAISREISKIRKGPIPKFMRSHLKWYGIIVEFEDEWSMIWLTENLCKLQPWSGARLKLLKPPFNQEEWINKFDMRSFF